MDRCGFTTKMNTLDLMTVVAALIIILTCEVRNVEATRCVKVDYSEIKDVGDWKYEARINKCEGMPSPYIIKSDVVTGVYEPTFRQERHHHGCCCHVTDYKEHRTVIGKVELRFKQVLECGCVPCRNPPTFSYEHDPHYVPAPRQQLQDDRPQHHQKNSAECQLPMILLKYLSKRNS